MAYPIPFTCPACAQYMAVTELTCSHCDTRVKGTFSSLGLNRLNAEQVQFVEVFVRCRGNIKEVEKDLKISYPTVRSRLNQVIETMGYALTAMPEESQIGVDSSDVLSALETGDISFEEALQIIRERKNAQ